MNNNNLPNNDVNSTLDSVPNTSVPPVSPQVNQTEVSEVPIVAPPIVNQNNNVMGEDGILKPFVNQPVEKLVSEPVAIQPDVIVDNNGDLKKEPPIIENTKMEKVNIEYKPPGKIKVFFMILFFFVLLGSILFLPEINQFLQSMQEEKPPVVDETEILDGYLTCNLETSNDTFDLIYALEFSFENKLLKSLNYDVTTRGDKTLDFDSLSLLYNNCKSLSAELNQNDLGSSISCDMFDGLVTTSESIDYTTLNLDQVNKLYEKYSMQLPNFELNENISDIERNLKSSGYTCEIRKSD